MSALIDLLWWLLGLLLVILIVMALLAPFESLGWWSGWSKRQVGGKQVGDGTGAQAIAAEAAKQGVDAPLFLIYLTGILGVKSGVGGARESDLVARIAARLPEGTVVIEDVFPYSVTNNPLSGERLFASAWTWINARRLSKRNLINIYSAMIVTRNLLQVAVSADARYGPINNSGVARELARSLIRHGYRVGSATPIAIVGYSGGGQVAVGAARYLQVALDAPITVVGLGGVFTGDPGISSVDRVFQLLGSRDPLPGLVAMLYPGQWKGNGSSAWNRARAQGRIVEIDPGPMTHFGKYDYFGRHATLEDGTFYADRTAELAASALTEWVQERKPKPAA